METKLLEKHGEPGGDRSRGWHRKHVTCSFCYVQRPLGLLNLRDSREEGYAYSTREAARG